MEVEVEDGIGTEGRTRKIDGILSEVDGKGRSEEKGGTVAIGTGERIEGYWEDGWDQ